MTEVLSYEDLCVIRNAIRHERAERQWKAKRDGHEPKGVDQLLRLERIFDGLAVARRNVEQVA